MSVLLRRDGRALLAVVLSTFHRCGCCDRPLPLCRLRLVYDSCGDRCLLPRDATLAPSMLSSCVSVRLSVRHTPVLSCAVSRDSFLRAQRGCVARSIGMIWYTRLTTRHCVSSACPISTNLQSQTSQTEATLGRKRARFSQDVKIPGSFQQNTDSRPTLTGQKRDHLANTALQHSDKNALKNRTSCIVNGARR